MSLFLGPASVGKRTTVGWVVEHYQIRPTDFRFIPTLTADEAREIRRFSMIAPMGHTKLVAIRIDGASQAAQNILLKTLEEPTRRVRFILLATKDPIPTVVSRSRVFRFGYLDRGELSEVLTRLGSAALPHGGQVKPCLDRSDLSVKKHTALAALRAIFRNDTHAIDKLLGDWTPETHRLLAIWCMEAMTGRWDVYSRQESEEFAADQTVVRKLLVAATSTVARPKLVLRTLPEVVVRNRR